MDYISINEGHFDWEVVKLQLLDEAGVAVPTSPNGDWNITLGYYTRLSE